MLAKDLADLLLKDPDKEVVIEFGDWDELFTDGSYEAPVEDVREYLCSLSLLPVKE